MANPIINPPTKPTAPQVLSLQMTQAFLACQQAYGNVVKYVWAKPANAQAAFNSFTAAGYKASDLVVNSQAYIAMMAVLGIIVPSPVPTGYSLTINADNSVTVNAPTS